jgi:hypothetical protein
MGKIQALLIQGDEDSWRGENDCRCQLWRLIYRHRMKESLFSQAKALVTKSFYNPTGYAQVLLLCTIVSKSVKSLQGQEAPPGLLTSMILPP